MSGPVRERGRDSHLYQVRDDRFVVPRRFRSLENQRVHITYEAKALLTKTTEIAVQLFGQNRILTSAEQNEIRTQAVATTEAGRVAQKYKIQVINTAIRLYQMREPADDDSDSASSSPRGAMNNNTPVAATHNPPNPGPTQTAPIPHLETRLQAAESEIQNLRQQVQQLQQDQTTNQQKAERILAFTLLIELRSQEIVTLRQQLQHLQQALQPATNTWTRLLPWAKSIFTALQIGHFLYSFMWSNPSQSSAEPLQLSFSGPSQSSAEPLQPGFSGPSQSSAEPLQLGFSGPESSFVPAIYRPLPQTSSVMIYSSASTNTCPNQPTCPVDNISPDSQELHDSQQVPQTVMSLGGISVPVAFWDELLFSLTPLVGESIARQIVTTGANAGLPAIIPTGFTAGTILDVSAIATTIVSWLSNPDSAPSFTPTVVPELPPPTLPSLPDSKSPQPVPQEREMPNDLSPSATNPPSAPPSLTPFNRVLYRNVKDPSHQAWFRQTSELRQAGDAALQRARDANFLATSAGQQHDWNYVYAEQYAAYYAVIPDPEIGWQLANFYTTYEKWWKENAFLLWDAIRSNTLGEEQLAQGRARIDSLRSLYANHTDPKFRAHWQTMECFFNDDMKGALKAAETHAHPIIKYIRAIASDNKTLLMQLINHPEDTLIGTILSGYARRALDIPWT